jgi:hypothetical protein
MEDITFAQEMEFQARYALAVARRMIGGTLFMPKAPYGDL